ncbi:phosphotransferase family protein [Pseudofrankia inefficax]|uniref:Aminoglycoside phosphotransferase n=1 Tax=Pseudofrankia inefficax (strain DSM 45817 / CECT 9037 / DDB 130130 / EuI1c) TaxID=298654 RepID=E3J7T7_PSEI1|nr:phosphotransferase family protein [Pseudofrankia inefficax]ADP80841.1 aminoglycoside phosphotransferase [Pseudofrankia inefficax]
MPVVPIDEQDLQRRASAAVAAAVPGGVLGPLTRLQGGTSSITYWAELSVGSAPASKVVAKVAPAGLAPTKNRDVLRQARLQQALRDTGVPCPAVVAEHEGTPPEIPPFYVMSFEDGDCVEPNSLPEDESLPPGEVRARELDAARVLGLLHALDPVAVGLGDEPTVTPEQELTRWTSSLAACDEDFRPGYEEVRDRLEAAIPARSESSLIHGDFRLGNTLSKGTGVVSVIDWEIWARSDPRVDLAWFLMMCNPDPELGRRTSAGMPSDKELLDVYQESRGATVEHMHWFDALVRYKQAAISALINRNARRRGAPPPFTGTPALLRSASKLLSG